MKGIHVDGIKEEVVNEPNVSWEVPIQALRYFKVLEKELPLWAKTHGEISPQVLNAHIVYTAI